MSSSPDRDEAVEELDDEEMKIDESDVSDCDEVESREDVDEEEDRELLEEFMLVDFIDSASEFLSSLDCCPVFFIFFLTTPDFFINEN